MFVAIARFPEVPAEQEEAFQEWFAWSNDQLRGVDGLTGRRLLRAADGAYTALVEHRSPRTFEAMHTTEASLRVHAQLEEILADGPRPTTYVVVTDLSTSGSCCGGGGGGRAGQLGQLVAAGAAEAPSAHGSGGGGCCRDA